MDTLLGLVQSIYDGVAIGSVYALIAIGITLVYGLSKIINFAVGEMTMLGAFVAWWIHEETGSFVVAGIVAVISLGVVGLVVERSMFRFTLDAPLSGFIVSLGLIIFLKGLAVEIWGPDTRSVEPPVAGVQEIGSLVLRNQTLINIAIGLVVLIVFYLMLDRSKLGAALRSISDDREAAVLMGVPVKRIITWTFVIASTLAGVAGWIVLTLGSISPFIGGSFMLRGFAVALIGGLGNIRGAAVAGVFLGVLENLAVRYGDPSWSGIYVFGIVIVVMLWRPTGIGRGAEGASL